MAIRTGLRNVGAVDSTIGVYGQLMDSESICLAPNSETVYFWNGMDLKDGPVVVETPAEHPHDLPALWRAPALVRQAVEAEYYVEVS